MVANVGSEVVKHKSKLTSHSDTTRKCGVLETVIERA